MTAKFQDLERYQSDLRTLFLEHQEKLVERRFGEAGARLEAFTSALGQHLRDEERLVELVPLPPGWEDVLRDDRERLLDALTQVADELYAFAGDGAPARIVRIIEREMQVKALFERHFERAQKILFPALDRALPAMDRKRLLASCALRVEALEYFARVGA